MTYSIDLKNENGVLYIKPIDLVSPNFINRSERSILNFFIAKC